MWNPSLWFVYTEVLTEGVLALGMETLDI